ncbi:MAG: sigma-54 dependent transcriptional regulator [Acidobacteriota bacterium]
MARGAVVLVVDDEAYVRDSLVAVLRRRGHDARGACSVGEALGILDQGSFDAVITDLRMPGEDGIQLLRRLSASSPDLPVIVLTGHGTVPSAVECILAGAIDYLLKPADPDQIHLILERIVGQGTMRRELEYLRTAGAEEDADVIGCSAAWTQTLRIVDAAAPSNSTVLLAGESGTGKEVLARRLHRRSQRAAAPFVSVNCAAIPLELFESEFFGYRKGAFTGAVSDRVGRFRVADGGTLFMDEIGAMPAAAQAKLLRVLQNGEFERIGDTRPTRVDVRLVAATNLVLEEEIASGRFRQDLYYRINVVQVRVPPLRERPEDIPLLAEHFMQVLAPRVGRRLRGLETEAMRLLQEYGWPGNVRELRNVIERALILENAPTLTPASLPLSLRDAAVARASPLAGVSAPAAVAPGEGPGAAVPGGAGAGAPPGDLNLRRRLAERERQILLEALRCCGGVRKEAARLLGIDQRNLAYYLRKHRLGAGKVVP